jgi:phosphate:Na+ symporter
MIVGQSVGTAVTTGLVMIGGSLSVRRASMAHIVFSIVVGVLGILFLGPLTAAADWVGARLYDPDGVLAMATFSSLFKLAGIVVFYPWLDQFAGFIIRISGAGSESAVNRLDPTLAQAGAGVALDAAWRAILEIAHTTLDAIRRRLAGESVDYPPPTDAVREIEDFLASLPLETTNLSTIGPRLVRLLHTLDDLTALHDDLTRIPPTVSAWHPPPEFEAGAYALGAWVRATKEVTTTPDPAILDAIEDASKKLRAERRMGREKILEDIALQRTPVSTARAALETFVWADLALYHSWHLVESIRAASEEAA